MPRRNPYGWTFCPIVLFLLRDDCDLASPPLALARARAQTLISSWPAAWRALSFSQEPSSQLSLPAPSWLFSLRPSLRELLLQPSRPALPCRYLPPFPPARFRG